MARKRVPDQDVPESRNFREIWIFRRGAHNCELLAGHCFEPKMAKPFVVTVPSCGQSLLRGPRESFDYVVRITSDNKRFVKIFCHRAILMACSPAISDQIRKKDNYFDLEIKVHPGYVAACCELIQYMYLKNPKLVKHPNKVLKLCGVFEMPLEHFMFRVYDKPPESTSCTVVLPWDCNSEMIASADFGRNVCIERDENRLDSGDKSVTVSSGSNSPNAVTAVPAAAPEVIVIDESVGKEPQQDQKDESQKIESQKESDPVASMPSPSKVVKKRRRRLALDPYPVMARPVRQLRGGRKTR